MTCKGICIRFKTKKAKGESLYDNHKRCTHCSKFVKTDEIGCPCCGLKLRCGPRKKEYKLKRQARAS